MKPRLIRRLRERCLAEIKDYKNEGKVIHGASGMHIFKDRGSNVLGVAHLDTVETWRNFRMRSSFVMSPQLDDRLGAWVILDVLGDLNIDVLLTEGEEKGRSTAADFEPPRQYNWMFSFDRGGDDTVLYRYDFEPKFVSSLEKHGFVIGRGMVSDICYLQHLGCRGMNIGVGYQLYHSRRAYADLDVTAQQVHLFRQFYREHKDTHFPYRSLCTSCSKAPPHGSGYLCSDCKKKVYQGTKWRTGEHELWDEDAWQEAYDELNGEGSKSSQNPFSILSHKPTNQTNQKAIVVPASVSRRTEIPEGEEDGDDEEHLYEIEARLARLGGDVTDPETGNRI